MGKEQVVLKDMAYAPLFRGQVNALFRVEEGNVIQGDFAAVWAHQAADEIEDRGLARARWPEYRRDRMGARHIDFKGKFSELFVYAQGEHGLGFHFAGNGLAGDERAQREDDGEDDQARGRCFAVGLVDVRENGEREGAGFAGDVGDKGDGRAKFAQAAGKCQEASHEHARRGQAQRNGNKGAKRMGAEGARCAFKPGVDAFNRQAHGSQHEREPHHSSRQNSTAPRKRNLHPKPFAQNMTQKPSASQQQEKQIADHDGRQHEGQVAQAVEEELAAKVFARQHPPQRDGKGQADHHAEHAHLEREGEDGVFFGSWEYHKK